MAIIFYSVCGEGMGHATRSEVVISHLLEKGHKVVIFSYERAYEYLKGICSKKKGVLEIVKISGFNLVYEKNQMILKNTIKKEYKKIPSFVFGNVNIFRKKAKEYSPSLFVSDFELSSGLYARLMKIPIIYIDNNGLMNRCVLDRKIGRSLLLPITEISFGFKIDYYFIVSFMDLPIKKRYQRNTFFTGPIIRKPIIEIKKSNGSHILVYQTSTSNNRLFDIFKSSRQKYIVYGFNRDEMIGNITFKTPSVEGFAKDLASCSGVITNGGFTLMSEAIYLKKPIYSIPVKKQIEQEVNAYYLEKLGYGLTSKDINKKTLDLFLKNKGRYKKNLEKNKMNINDFSMIDEAIKEALKSESSI